MKRSPQKLKSLLTSQPALSLQIQFYLMVIWVNSQLRLLSSASKVIMTNDISWFCSLWESLSSPFICIQNWYSLDPKDSDVWSLINVDWLLECLRWIVLCWCQVLLLQFTSSIDYESCWLLYYVVFEKEQGRRANIPVTAWKSTWPRDCPVLTYFTTEF